jgi:hypothetical protein
MKRHSFLHRLTFVTMQMSKEETQQIEMLKQRLQPIAWNVSFDADKYAQEYIESGGRLT